MQQNSNDDECACSDCRLDRAEKKVKSLAHENKELRRNICDHEYEIGMLEQEKGMPSQADHNINLRNEIARLKSELFDTEVWGLRIKSENDKLKSENANLRLMPERNEVRLIIGIRDDILLEIEREKRNLSSLKAENDKLKLSDSVESAKIGARIDNLRYEMAGLKGENILFKDKVGRLEEIAYRKSKRYGRAITELMVRIAELEEIVSKYEHESSE